MFFKKLFAKIASFFKSLFSEDGPFSTNRFYDYTQEEEDYISQIKKMQDDLDNTKNQQQQKQNNQQQDTQDQPQESPKKAAKRFAADRASLASTFSYLNPSKDDAKHSSFITYCVTFASNTSVPLSFAPSLRSAHLVVSVLVFYERYDHFINWCSIHNLKPTFGSETWNQYLFSSIDPSDPSTDPFTKYSIIKLNYGADFLNSILRSYFCCVPTPFPFNYQDNIFRFDLTFPHALKRSNPSDPSSSFVSDDDPSILDSYATNSFASPSDVQKIFEFRRTLDKIQQDGFPLFSGDLPSGTFPSFIDDISSRQDLDHIIDVFLDAQIMKSGGDDDLVI